MVFLVTDGVLGVVLVMQAFPYFSELFYDVRRCGMMSKSGGMSTWQVD